MSDICDSCRIFTIGTYCHAIMGVCMGKAHKPEPDEAAESARRGRVKIGAIVWMDFRPWTWPELPHGDGSIVFAIKDSPMKGYVTCRADYFGVLKPHGIYGNGSLHVKESDIVSI